MEQIKAIVAAARTLTEHGDGSFTMQELVKESGIGMQTFYRYFESKDHVLLAVYEQLVVEQATWHERATAEISDPVDRLHHHIVATLALLDSPGAATAGGRFLSGERWRLHQHYPTESVQARWAFADLVSREIKAAEATGQLPVGSAQRSADLITRLVESVYHHCSYAPRAESGRQIGEQVWAFCLSALHGAAPARPADAQGGETPAGDPRGGE
ncbi:TetR/AcrR family transcriptional regulator [Frankia sp. AgPm24]|uniref:TetR/AcrR family transcriptional regulator n=1 Tax=Frankia sp. AgPm24 TaxID=631128 RepID=UPI00200E3810|nr:TetR/AcrR family transcriptional regulator [Frankia sp. AgPm24]MCK9925066.1 TetR/AcrR family transcriptional regulator [Frankia sp. AgPm24]